MNNMVFERNGKTIVRVNKAKARKMYNNGIDVLFIPCNLRPDSPYMLGIWENINLGDEKIPFEKLVDYFEIYNCINSETGKYTAFYIEDDDYDYDDGNMPCDYSGMCAGTSCSQYWNCKGGK